MIEIAMATDNFTSGRGSARSRRGFTIIELLVVFAIIAILFSAVLVGGTTVLTKARIRNTRVVLQVVQDSLEEFRRESPPIITAYQPGTGGKTVRYRNRYGEYPPDETELFTEKGIPGSSSGRSLAPGQASFIPAPGTSGPGYDPMEFYTAGNPNAALEHRDLAAMMIAIQQLTETAAAMLDKIPESNWSPGILDADGNPLQFLDVDDNATWDPGVDQQVRFIVDEWGVPISYFAQRDFDPDDPEATESSNADGWNQTSTEIIFLNKGRPVIMSYGPNGREQLGKELQTAENSTASLVGDWIKEDEGLHRINDPYNADNVYTDADLKERLAEGIPLP